jgi:flagellin-specific chaperone FliS
MKDPADKDIEEYVRENTKRYFREMENKRRRFKPDRKKQTSNLLSTMRMIRQIKELSATLNEEDKNKLAKELEKTIESIKRKLDRL